MKLHRIEYTTNNHEGINTYQEFFASDTEASKRCTELKKNGDLDGKPERGPIEIPTSKPDLLAWLNTNASYVKMVSA